MIVRCGCGNPARDRADRSRLAGSASPRWSGEGRRDLAAPARELRYAGRSPGRVRPGRIDEPPIADRVPGAASRQRPHTRSGAPLSPPCSTPASTAARHHSPTYHVERCRYALSPSGRTPSRWRRSSSGLDASISRVSEQHCLLRRPRPTMASPNSGTNQIGPTGLPQRSEAKRGSNRAQFDLCKSFHATPARKRLATALGAVWREGSRIRSPSDSRSEHSAEGYLPRWPKFWPPWPAGQHVRRRMNDCQVLKSDRFI